MNAELYRPHCERTLKYGLRISLFQFHKTILPTAVSLNTTDLDLNIKAPQSLYVHHFMISLTLLMD